MKDKEPETHDPEEKTSSTGELVLTSSPEVVVRPLEEAAKTSAGKGIHPRRPLPPVPVAPVAADEEGENAARPDSGEAPPK